MVDAGTSVDDTGGCGRPAVVCQVEPIIAAAAIKRRLGRKRGQGAIFAAAPPGALGAIVPVLQRTVARLAPDMRPLGIGDQAVSATAKDAPSRLDRRTDMDAVSTVACVPQQGGARRSRLTGSRIAAFHCRRPDDIA